VSGHKPAIGLVLCRGRSKAVTEWALRGIDTPVPVARYTTGDTALTDQAPAELKPALPDLPDLAKELAKTVETAEAISTNVLDADLAADQGLSR
jgi:YhcG PDDEXK nuclease domain